jgi:hypothetical protein
MRYISHSHQHAEEVLASARFQPLLREITKVIEGISDEQIVGQFNSMKPAKSLSKAINALLKMGFIREGWTAESAIFQGKEFKAKKWRLDFAKETISIEVAFNHGEAIAWNLLKPVMASQQNHIKKAMTTEVGVIICATKSLKVAGNFDNAVGEYEKFLRYLTPMQAVLPTPLLIIGLEMPSSFQIVGKKVNGKNIGSVERL